MEIFQVNTLIKMTPVLGTDHPYVIPDHTHSNSISLNSGSGRLYERGLLSRLICVVNVNRMQPRREIGKEHLSF